MSRERAKITYKLPYWCSGAADCSEKIFVQIGASLMQHPAFTGLKDSARWTYLAMMLEAKGRPDFQFPRRTAELYGISERSLRRNVQELEAAGLVDVVASGRNTKSATDYRFSVRWKAPP